MEPRGELLIQYHKAPEANNTNKKVARLSRKNRAKSLHSDTSENLSQNTSCMCRRLVFSCWVDDDMDTECKLVLFQTKHE